MRAPLAEQKYDAIAGVELDISARTNLCMTIKWPVTRAAGDGGGGGDTNDTSYLMCVLSSLPHLDITIVGRNFLDPFLKSL